LTSFTAPVKMSSDCHKATKRSSITDIAIRAHIIPCTRLIVWLLNTWMNPVGSFQAPSGVEAEYFSCTTRTLTSAQEKKCRQNHIQSASRLKKSIQSANTSQTCTEPSTVTHSSMENALAHDESLTSIWSLITKPPTPTWWEAFAGSKKGSSGIQYVSIRYVSSAWWPTLYLVQMISE